MSADSGADKIREWAASDREQIDAIRYLSAVGDQDVHSSLSVAQADTLEATAQGWDAIADAVDDAVDDPDQH